MLNTKPRQKLIFTGAIHIPWQRLREIAEQGSAPTEWLSKIARPYQKHQVNCIKKE